MGKTKHKIFISQATLKMGRCRAIRTLERKMDNPTHKNPESKLKIGCSHYEYCNVKAFGNINCITDYKNCQTHKFYERYGK